MTRPLRNPLSAGSVRSLNPVDTAPLKTPRTHRRARLRLGPIRLDLFVTGRPWWLPLDRR